MAIIHPEGLFNGQRLRACSDTARLLWPYLFLASNSFGRIEIDYTRIIREVFVGFRNPPKSAAFFKILREYHDNGLLFLYENGSQVWGQWDCKPGSLPRYQTAKDKETPAPDAKIFENWRKTCLLKTKPLPIISEIFEKFPRREGVGIGVGVGKESSLAGAKEKPPQAARSLSGKAFTPPTPEQVREYADSLDYAIDAERFCAWHGSRGWKGIADWHQAVLLWRTSEVSTPKSRKSPAKVPVCETCGGLGEVVDALSEDATIAEIDAARKPCPECRSTENSLANLRKAAR